ncbi:hypothetical protein AB8O38_20990, partial [Saccharomonospora xinjiangensis]
MSDDHGTPGLTSQAEEWRARAQRNREEAERKRRRALDTQGGISVAEMLARHAAERSASEPNGRARRSRQQRRAAERDDPVTPSASRYTVDDRVAVEAPADLPAELPVEVPAAAPSQHTTGRHPRQGQPESPSPASRPRPAERPRGATPPAPPGFSRRDSGRPEPARPELTRPRPSPVDGGVTTGEHPKPLQQGGPDPMRSGHFPMPDVALGEPPRHVPVRGDVPVPDHPLAERSGRFPTPPPPNRPSPPPNRGIPATLDAPPVRRGETPPPPSRLP